MGTSNVESAEQSVKAYQKVIANYQAELKSPNISKTRKEAVRKLIAQNKEHLARAKENLKIAKAQAKKR